MLQSESPNTQEDLFMKNRFIAKLSEYQREEICLSQLANTIEYGTSGPKSAVTQCGKIQFTITLVHVAVERHNCTLLICHMYKYWCYGGLFSRQHNISNTFRASYTYHTSSRLTTHHFYCFFLSRF